MKLQNKLFAKHLHFLESQQTMLLENFLWIFPKMILDSFKQNSGKSKVQLMIAHYLI